jgi:hypothetical protein
MDEDSDELLAQERKIYNSFNIYYVNVITLRRNKFAKIYPIYSKEE